LNPTISTHQFTEGIDQQAQPTAPRKRDSEGSVVRPSEPLAHDINHTALIREIED